MKRKTDLELCEGTEVCFRKITYAICAYYSTARKELSMDKEKAIQILEDAIMVWKELEWFNRHHDHECHLYFGDSIQLVDDSEHPGIGSLAEDIADALNMTRAYSPNGLCYITYKGYEFFSNWRAC